MALLVDNFRLAEAREFSNLIKCDYNGTLTLLVPGKESAFNPCALSLSLIGFYVFYFLAGNYQQLLLKRRPSYGTWSAKSVGIVQHFRLLLMFFQATLYFVVFADLLQDEAYGFFNLSTLLYLIPSLVIFTTILPLHSTEVHKSIWQTATPLTFWPASLFFLGASVYQTNFTRYPIVSSSLTFAKGAELVLFANAFIVFILETFFWHRAYEYTHHLKLNEVDENSLYHANVFGRITFSHLNPLIHKCYRENVVEFKDLPQVDDTVKDKYASSVLKKHWDAEQSKKTIRLSRPIAKAYGGQVLVCVVLEILYVLVGFVQPQLLRLLMSFFLREEYNLLEGILICVGMTVNSFVYIILWNEYINQMFNVSLKLRVGMTSLIYDKALRLSTEARANRTVGDIVNLISVDVSRVEYLTTKVQAFLSAPLQFILCLYSLYFLLGWTAFTGLSVVFVALPINLMILKRFEKLFDKNMKFKDLRTKTVSEILNSIKSIKLYSWEKPMNNKVKKIRDEKELKTMKTIGIFDALLSFSWNCVPYFVSCVTFGIYAYVGPKKLTSELIFPALSLFNLLGDPLFEIPDVFSALIETKVSVNRLLKFLCDSELDPNLLQSLEAVKKGESAVEIKNASFVRSAKKEAENENADEENSIESPKVALSNINFTAKKGELTCIVGSVGSGKSTFLQSLLGQLSAVSADSKLGAPSIKIAGAVAYCPQQPWIMNASIKKNILFGRKYDPEFFEKTIEACELKTDFEILPDGDETQVGEKGISLSGGQKARISLARAVYARADVYLLDDVLSAVDAHVSKNIIEKVLNKSGILASKTLILSTNHIHVLKEADSIYVLDHGKIDEQGTFDELVANAGDFAKLIEEFGKSDEKSADEETVIAEAETAAIEAKNLADVQPETMDESTDENEVLELVENEQIATAELSRVKSNVTLRRASAASFNFEFAENEKKKDSKTGQTAEVSKKGKVGRNTYKRYAKAAKYRNIIITLLAVWFMGLSELFGKLWLKHWAEINDRNDKSADTVFLVTIYTLLGFLSGLGVLLRSVALFYFSAVSASKLIHEELVSSILKSPMSFFETTPTGRILNRFSEDVSRLDERFPHALSFFVSEVVKAIYTLTLIAITLPSTIIAMLVLAIVYYYIQDLYMSPSRECKRLASTTRSPLYSHIHETLTGIETIKAFKEEERFKHISSSNMDHSTTATFSSIWMTRWLNFRLKSISTIFLLAVSLSCIASVTTAKPLSAGVVGLLITFSFQITEILNWLVRMSVEVETNAVAIERILEYCDLPHERPYVIEDSRPPVQWPTKGGIKFVNYTTKYKEDSDPVLKNISFEVKPQEKIGIVGRTGAGKSTLTLALFRIIEATGGNIIIDDVDTSKIGLYDLRSKLNIIPQDSQAFQGTVRQNLDPFNKFKDEELWKVLEMAHLKDHVMQMKDEKKESDDDDKKKKDDESDAESGLDEEGSPLSPEAIESAGKGLYAKISEGGSNLSAGQKQLLCLARALLNPSKILLLDEATAAVDVKTDKIVQDTIRKEFNDKTILTIAHRIDTIMDNDKILVLDQGEVKEFDSPENLLKDKNTIFYSLCEKGGYLKK